MSLDDDHRLKPNIKNIIISHLTVNDESRIYGPAIQQTRCEHAKTLLWDKRIGLALFVDLRIARAPVLLESTWDIQCPDRPPITR